jgi:excisionase family DNA binding protein
MKHITCNQTAPAFVSKAEIAEIIGVTTHTIANWADNGTIPVGLRIGRTIRFNPEEVFHALGQETERSVRARRAKLETRNSDKNLEPEDEQPVIPKAAVMPEPKPETLPWN